jgi:hypothetical protein
MLSSLLVAETGGFAESQAAVRSDFEHRALDLLQVTLAGSLLASAAQLSSPRLRRRQCRLGSHGDGLGLLLRDRGEDVDREADRLERPARL